MVDPIFNQDEHIDNKNCGDGSHNVQESSPGKDYTKVAN